MKLRLDRNSIRLRLDAGDVKRLARGESLTHAVHFGAGEHDRFTYEIRVGDQVAEVRAELADRAIIVHMPDAFARDWAAGGEAGVEAAQFADGDRMLGVLLEKDAGCGHGGTETPVAAVAEVD